ncbi:MAG: hypothetical protein JO112_04915 [Planctomycetes bacterium]|nr:hypothetical protein [Planctomycetota bacterium]
MPKAEQPRPTKELEQHRREALKTLLEEQVLHALGRPGDLQRVQVWPLWENHYRVNILVGVDPVSMRVAHSFFLLGDGEGNILASTPEITRQY